MRLEAIAIRLEAIPLRLQAIALRLEAIALRLEAIPLRLQAIALRLKAITLRLQAIALRLEAITLRLQAIPLRLLFASLCHMWFSLFQEAWRDGVRLRRRLIAAPGCSSVQVQDPSRGLVRLRIRSEALPLALKETQESPETLSAQQRIPCSPSSRCQFFWRDHGMDRICDCRGLRQRERKRERKKERNCSFSFRPFCFHLVLSFLFPVVFVAEMHVVCMFPDMNSCLPSGHGRCFSGHYICFLHSNLAYLGIYTPVRCEVHRC